LFYPLLMAAARFHDLLDDPAVLVAGRWQEWLHPRGIDGRFIQKGGMVDVFAGKSDETTLRNPQADRRRAKITELFPQGVQVQYFDTNGKPIPADPKNGYPSNIPLDQVVTRISSAPNSRARLSDVSSKAEFDQSYHPAKTQHEYDAAIKSFNDRITAELKPERSAAQRGGGPLTDKQYLAHAAYVADVTDLGLGKQKGDVGIGLASDSAFKDNHGNWSQEQLKNMLTMADELFGTVTAGRPKGHKAIMLGGLPGSGKSSLLEQMQKDGHFDEADWVQINPDLVKDEMIKRGWYPEIEGLTANETAGFIHAQSSEMASMLERMAMKDGFNLIFDTTMGGLDDEGKPWTEHTLNYLSAYGYDKPDGIFINATTDHSLASIAYRHRTGLEKYRTGEGGDRSSDLEVKNGGRFVPNKVVASTTSNVDTFDRLKGKFNRWASYEVGNAPGEKPKPELLDSTGSGDQMPGVFPAGAFDGVPTG
jgi:hypothetical protein